MITNIKYELVKLFTVRSTYIMSLLAIGFSLLVTVIHIVNLKHTPGALTGISVASMMTYLPIVSSIIGSIAAILLVGHEYRYNTIAYTLTASPSRTNVLLAKLCTTIGFSAVLNALGIGIGLAGYYLGLHIRHFVLPPQTIDLAPMFGRVVLYGVGSALLALVIALLVRNIVFAIVAIFVLPTLEQLLALWLKHNAAYLPNTALAQVGNVPGTSAALLSALKGGLVFSAYIVVAWIIAWILFMRKDAN